MPADVAKALLEGRAFVEPNLTEGARNLIRLASRQAGGHEHGGPAGWCAALEDADVVTIIAAIGGLPYREHLEAARSMVERKLTERMVAKMEDLERASNRLGRIAIGFAFAAVAVAVVQIVIEVGVRP